jgi:hypothetical protein
MYTAQKIGRFIGALTILATATLICAGCATTLDRTALSGTVANYSAMANHKAFYMYVKHQDHYYMSWSYGKNTVDEAQATAKATCETNIDKFHGGNCYLLALDDTRTGLDLSAEFEESGPDPFAALALMSAASSLANSRNASNTASAAATLQAVNGAHTLPNSAPSSNDLAALHRQIQQQEETIAAQQKLLANQQPSPVHAPSAAHNAPQSSSGTPSVGSGGSAAPVVASLPSACLDQSTDQQLSDTAVYARNTCNETININICAVFAGDIGSRRQANPAAPGQNLRFSFFNPDNLAYRYALQYCRPDHSGRVDNCPAACPSVPAP